MNGRSDDMKKYRMLILVFVWCSILVGCNRVGNAELNEDLERVTMAQSEKDLVPNNETALPESKEADIATIKGDVEINLVSYETLPQTEKSFYEEVPKVRGLYVTGPTAGNSNMAKILELIDTTEANALVIDVKNDDGHMTFKVDHPIVNEIGAYRNYIKDIEGLMNTLYEKDIYPIARIVAFKDPYLAERYPDYAIKNQDGSVWRYQNVAWLNPYNEDAWVYIVDMAKEAVKVGFKEIQFDYIRFEATNQLKDAYFGEIDPEKSRRDIIAEFIEYANQELKPLGVKISADVFGTIINSEVDSKLIGQEYMEMAKRLDVICPMVYPSHYGKGFFGIPRDRHSDHYPYETIYGSMLLSNERYKELQAGETAAIVRPWLQAFTASYLGSGNYRIYDGTAIREQIQGVYDAGLEEWILWNASNRYQENALLMKGDTQ